MASRSRSSPLPPHSFTRDVATVQSAKCASSISPFRHSIRQMSSLIKGPDVHPAVGPEQVLVHHRLTLLDRTFSGLRTPKKITYRFSISSSGRLWPFLNREILNVGPLRLRFRSIDHDQIQPKSERIIRQLIVLHALRSPILLSKLIV